MSAPVAPLQAPALLETTNFVVIGAGGLGCPALLGLVGAGARRLTIIDDDHVDASNLARQVLFAPSDVGVSKARAARCSVLALASQPLTVTALEQRLSVSVSELGPQLQAIIDALAGPAIVLECSDDPALKFAVHDACFALGIPVVVAGVIGWRGQVMAVDPRRRDRACYRCLFEEPPPSEFAQACTAVGVVGAVAGTLGHAMAMLAVDLASDLVGAVGGAVGPEAAGAGSLTHFDLLGGTIRRLAPAARPDCRNFHGDLP